MTGPCLHSVPQVKCEYNAEDDKLKRKRQGFPDFVPDQVRAAHL